MAGKDRLDQLKTQFDKLRKDSLDAVAKANRIVSVGVQKFADKELKALNEHYKSALASIKKSNKNSGIKDLAQKQIDSLQSTAQRLIASARDSIGAVAKSRAELSALVQKSARSGGVTAPNLAKVTRPAKKAIKDVKAAATKAKKEVIKVTKSAKKNVAKATKSAQKEVKKDVKKAKGVAKKAEAQAKKTVKSAQKTIAKVQKSASTKASAVKKSVEKTVSSVLDLAPPPVAKKTVTAKPSPTSRANRASSKVKKNLTDSTIPPKIKDSTIPPKVKDSTIPPKKPSATGGEPPQS